ncbi:CopG family transcriptional regulator [Pseudonocardia sp.]|uniref:ribbon-helix-helix domain-containing protein n=1 Tax=Pseudonocardia sp. TaxID=60912 RepID=UPI002624C60B|nr:CopG family transcriptional regulator [Pseudonocardia sp.]
MNRTNIYLTDEQREQLDARARAEGMSRAELIRRVLDRALHGESDRLTADLAAITGSFGALADDGVEFDRGDGARGAHLERIAGRR